MNILAAFGFDDLRLVNLISREGKIFGGSCCRRWLFLLRLCRLLCRGTFRSCFGFRRCLFGSFAFRSYLFGCFGFRRLLFGGWLLFTSFAWRSCIVRICRIRFFSHMRRFRLCRLSRRDCELPLPFCEVLYVSEHLLKCVDRARATLCGDEYRDKN